jgi:hypothetical protein
MATRNTFLGPGPPSKGQAEHGSQHVEVARFVPNGATDLCVDIGRHESCNRGMVTGYAQDEVVLQLFLVAYSDDVN